MTLRDLSAGPVALLHHAVRFVDVCGHRLEYVDIPAHQLRRPTLVFLHEGLGSVSMWRDFPANGGVARGVRVSSPGGLVAVPTAGAVGRSVIQ